MRGAAIASRARHRCSCGSATVGGVASQVALDAAADGSWHGAAEGPWLRAEELGAEELGAEELGAGDGPRLAAPDIVRAGTGLPVAMDALAIESQQHSNSRLW